MNTPPILSDRVSLTTSEEFKWKSQASLQALQTQVKDSTTLYESEYFVWREHIRVKKTTQYKEEGRTSLRETLAEGRERKLPTSHRTCNTKYLLLREGKKRNNKDENEAMPLQHTKNEVFLP